MKESANAPRQYKLSAHEFKARGNKPKTGFTFSLETSAGRASNSVAGSAIARDLLVVLQQSKTGAQLISEVQFEFRMDREFVLHVTRKSPEPEATSTASS